MTEDKVNHFFQDISKLPGLTKTAGGLVPLPLGNHSVIEDVLFAHCLYKEPFPELDGVELLDWFRRQASLVVQAFSRQCSKEDVCKMAVTIRFKERGENHILYGCDIAEEQILSFGDGVVCDPAKIATKEWTHDDKIETVLHRPVQKQVPD